MVKFLLQLEVSGIYIPLEDEDKLSHIFFSMVCDVQVMVVSGVVSDGIE